MAQREVELILLRQPASYLTIPIFVVDTKGTLIYFNEPAEVLVSRRFEEPDVEVVRLAPLSWMCHPA